MERLGKYISDVKDGTIPACHFVKLSITRFENDLLREDLIFLPEKAQKVIDFIAILKHTVGKFDDKPFILSPFQVFIVANLYGFYNLDGSRRFTSAYIELARKSGKALSLDTKIPTPDGWSTMGELQIGDIILDEAGNPTNVTFVTPTQYNRNCYEVEFEDGEKVIADENHQ